MKYGMNMLLWTGDCTTPEFPALFERLKKTGFDLVEIPIFDPNPKKLAALAKKLDSIGLERTAVTCLNADNNLVGEDKKQRAAGVKHLKAVIDCCQAMGVKKLVGSATAYRIRIGDYQVIYVIEDATITVTVTHVAHRREAY